MEIDISPDMKIEIEDMNLQFQILIQIFLISNINNGQQTMKRVNAELQLRGHSSLRQRACLGTLLVEQTGFEFSNFKEYT